MVVALMKKVHLVLDRAAGHVFNVAQLHNKQTTQHFRSDPAEHVTCECGEYYVRRENRNLVSLENGEKGLCLPFVTNWMALRQDLTLKVAIG